MKLYLLGLALVVFPTARARADNGEASLAAIASLPKCSKSCLLPLVSSSSCALTNMTCICSNENLQNDLAICVAKSCSFKDALNTKNITTVSCGAPIRNKGQEYVTISNTFGIISAVFVIQRFTYKIGADLGLGLDDWFTLATLVSGVPSTVMNAKCLTPNGMGRDAWTLTPTQITDFAKFFFIMEILYFFQVAALKLSLLFFYLGVFPGTHVQRSLWVTIAVTAMYGLVFVFVGSFQCRPLRYFWTKWDGEHTGTCVNVNVLAWSNAVISIVLDFWMLAVPLCQLQGLNLSLKRKLGVAIMFGVGTFITVVSILRLRSLVKFGADATNPTWEFFDVGLWSTIEINVGIICTCLPTARLLLARLFPRGLGTTQREPGKNSSADNAKPDSGKGDLAQRGHESSEDNDTPLSKTPDKDS